MIYFLFTLLFIAVFFLILAVYIFIILVYTKVPFVKTPRKSIDMILNNIKISPKDTVYDIGCGDASMLIAIEKKFGARTIGYEISPWAYLRGRINIFLNKTNTKIYYKNFYKEDLSQANVVFCFLIVSVMDKVGQQLKKQLKPGAKVISYGFHIPNWQPVEVINTGQNNPKSSKIYIYRI